MIIVKRHGCIWNGWRASTSIFSFRLPGLSGPIVERIEKQPICQLARVVVVKFRCDKSAKLLPVIAAHTGSSESAREEDNGTEKSQLQRIQNCRRAVRARFRPRRVNGRQDARGATLKFYNGDKFSRERQLFSRRETISASQRNAQKIFRARINPGRALISFGAESGGRDRAAVVRVTHPLEILLRFAVNAVNTAQLSLTDFR